MHETNAILTYWLCPAEPARTQLAALIADLAARFEAPVFEPHVTIYATNAANENPESALAAIEPARAPYQLQVPELGYANKFTKTLFIQFAENPDLSRLSEDLRRASASGDDYQLNPHLSLIYKEISNEMKRALATSLNLPLAEIAFDRIKAVLSPAKIESRREVEAWRVIAERSLTE